MKTMAEQGPTSLPLLRQHLVQPADHLETIRGAKTAEIENGFPTATQEGDPTCGRRDSPPKLIDVPRPKSAILEGGPDHDGIVGQ